MLQAFMRNLNLLRFLLFYYRQIPYPVKVNLKRNNNFFRREQTNQNKSNFFKVMLNKVISLEVMLSPLRYQTTNGANLVTNNSNNLANQLLNWMSQEGSQFQFLKKWAFVLILNVKKHSIKIQITQFSLVIGAKTNIV